MDGPSTKKSNSTTVLPGIVTEGDEHFLTVLDDGKSGTCYDGRFHRFPVDMVSLKMLLAEISERVLTEAQGK